MEMLFRAALLIAIFVAIPVIVFDVLDKEGMR